MTVFVRISGGYEDEYDAYQGCGLCPTPLNHVDDDGEVDCPDHGYTKPEFWNPVAKQGEDGALTVRKAGTPIGFYPSGSWVSWRSV